jgi:acetyl esterase/lipase
MNRQLTFALALILLAPSFRTRAEDPKNEGIYELWIGDAPNHKGVTAEDTPALQIFLPQAQNAKPTGASIIVCPGGAYAGRANHEGPVVGKWLAQNGVTAFVLRYRLASKGYHHPVQLMDGARAIRFVRNHAKSWNLDPNRIGILGFSAGGHLASTVATHFDHGDKSSPDPVDHESSRPDLQILIYPVITMAPNKRTSGGHDGSRKNLLGEAKANDQALIDLLSNEKQVTENTPPAFLVHTTEDTAVPVTNSDDYAAALKKHNVPYEYVRTEKGKHGFGLQDFWTKPCVEWLRKQKF